LILNESG